MVNGSNQLVVTENGTTVATLQLDGAYSGFTFVPQSVSGGTDIVATQNALQNPATVAQYLANVSGYDQISGGFAISNSAANIAGGLDQLNDTHINKITISDNGAIGVSVAQLTSDATAIGKLANANAKVAYQLAVTNSLSAIIGDLSGLNGNSHVASLTGTSGAATLSSGTIAAGAFTLTGSSTALTLAENLIYTKTFTEGAGATVSISTGDTLTLKGTTSLGGNVSGAGTLALRGGSATIGSGASLSVANLIVSGTGTSVTLAENLTYAGTFTAGSGTTLDVGGDTLTLTGTTSLKDNVIGAGTLAFAGGSATINSGTSLSVANLNVSGSGTSVTLAENLTYAGTFSAGSGTTLNLGGHTLTLTGTNSFVGTTTSVKGQLNANGTSTLSGLTVAGTTVFDVNGSLSESGGSATVGDASGNVAKAIIGSAGTWNILDDSAINRGSSASSSLTNSGMLEKTGGTGTSLIAPNVTNNGEIAVSSGTFDFKAAVSGTGTAAISAGATLEFDAAVSSSGTVGAQNIGFGAGGGTLDLVTPKKFYGEISNFAAGDAIDLLGNWKFSGISDVAGVTTLTLNSGTNKQNFTFVGDYAQSAFSIASGTDHDDYPHVRFVR